MSGVKQIIIIGRGHSGTRALGATLFTSGVYMGNISPSFDLIPGKPMYRVARHAGMYVRMIRPFEWDFSRLLAMSIPDLCRKLVDEYLSGFEGHSFYGWKLPETTLALPWITQMYPDAYYIHWVRDGRDNILKFHGTDRLKNWRIPSGGVAEKNNRLQCAAISWKYHEDLIAITPKPQHWLKVRFEDFVQHQGETLARLSDYLGIGLNAIPVFHDVVGRYLTEELNGVVEIMRPQLVEHRYIE